MAPLERQPAYDRIYRLPILGVALVAVIIPLDLLQDPSLGLFTLFLLLQRPFAQSFDSQRWQYLSPI